MGREKARKRVIRRAPGAAPKGAIGAARPEAIGERFGVELTMDEDLPPLVEQELQDAAERYRVARHDLEDAVLAARYRGVTWERIGSITGLTGEGARYRWGRP